jgi:CheY-like chemotaxis protein
LFPEGALEEILLHLVLVARDALPQGGLLSFESGMATVREHEEPWQAGVPCGNYLTLRVSDEGLGGFADPSENGQSLAAVCALIKHSGGYVELTRTPELATALTLYLPRVNSTPAELFEPAPAESAQPTASSAGFILIVDDEPMIRLSLRSLLERIGYRVLEAHDGAAALTLCRQQRAPIDVLLTDVILPGIQGVQLAREVQALRPQASVIFMSAYPCATLVRDGRLEPGMISLQKPFDESALAAALRQALSTRDSANPLPRAS